MRQIKDSQINLNNVSGSSITKLLEYIIVNDNLYLISEAHDISLVEFLPKLIHSNQENENVSIQVVHDLLKILKNVYQQQKVISDSVFESGSDKSKQN